MLGKSHGAVMVQDGNYTGTLTGRNVKFFIGSKAYQFELMYVTDLTDAMVNISIIGMHATVSKQK